MGERFAPSTPLTLRCSSMERLPGRRLSSAQLPKRLPLEAFPDCSGLATPPGLVFLPLPSLLALRGL